MKRIGFIFTVITLFCLSAVSRVIAQSDWSLINFDLINLPCEPGSHSLTYTMYYGVNPFKVKSFNDIERPIIFGGELVCTRSIDLKEKKEAVNRALSDLGWNFATLRQVIERAAQAKPNDITNEQFWDDLVSMSGLNGLAGDALALISGVKDRDKYYEAERIQGRLKSEAYKYLVNKTLSTVGKIFSLKGRIEIFLNARERDKQKWINCVAEDNLVSLARFYRIANNRLWQIAQTKDLDGDALLTVQARGRGVEHQVDGEARAALLILAEKDAAVVQHRCAPDARTVQPPLAGEDVLGLLMDEHTVAELLRQAQESILMQCIFGSAP